MTNEKPGEFSVLVNSMSSEETRLMLKDNEIQTSIGLVNPVILPVEVAAAHPNLGAYVSVIVSLFVSAILLVPLIVIPGLILFVLPTEIYLLGQVYDGAAEIRSRHEKSSPAIDLEKASKEVEDARIRAYGAHLAP